jgi:hypothetical protein
MKMGDSCFFFSLKFWQLAEKVLVDFFYLMDKSTNVTLTNFQMLVH